MALSSSLVTAMSLSIPVTPHPPSFWLTFPPFVAHCMMLYDAFSISTFYLVYSSCLFYNLVLLPLSPLPLLSPSPLFIYHISLSVPCFSIEQGCLPTFYSDGRVYQLPYLYITLPLKTNLISSQHTSQNSAFMQKGYSISLTVLILPNSNLCFIQQQSISRLHYTIVPPIQSRSGIRKTFLSLFFECWQIISSTLLPCHFSGWGFL